MNILHLVSYAVFSGPLPPTVQLAQAQRALGHNAWVAHDTLRGSFSPYEEGADAPLADSGVMLPNRPLGLSPKAGIAQLWRDRSTLARLAEELELDVVHTHLSHDHTLVALAGLASARRARPVRRVHTVHATRQLSGWPHRRWLWRHTDGVVVRSTADKRAVENVLPARSAAPVAVVPAAIDVGRWSRPVGGIRDLLASEVPALAALPAGTPLLVHVALMAERGQREMLEAWAQFFGRLRETRAQKQTDALPHLVFVGDGPQRAQLEQRAAALRLAGCVHFVGYLSEPTLRALYRRAAGAFVAQPGNDAGARAALEALAMEVPLIAVQVRAGDALAELAGEGRGQLLPDRQVPTLCAGLEAWWSAQPWQTGRNEPVVAWLRAQRSPRMEAAATVALYERSGRKPPKTLPGATAIK